LISFQNILLLTLLNCYSMSALPDQAPSSSSSSSIKQTIDDPIESCTLSLQDRLHTLLTRLSNTSKLLTKTEWPSADDARVHSEKTLLLIASIEKIMEAIKMVEVKVNSPEMYDKLRQVAIPLDLLDMMDCAGGVNPDCFARGLMDEASRQLGNLQRRKTSMKVLAKTIQNGMEQREKQLKIIESLDEQIKSSTSRENTEIMTMEIEQDTTQEEQVEKNNTKRKREDDEEEPEDAPDAKR
jgi:hypothetical protein